ncbi:MAG: hypothetical protein J4F49_11445 [Rhodobacteraceae bacterium]|nr:hypothetical protein [Paracoccaceae bacterium]
MEFAQLSRCETSNGDSEARTDDKIVLIGKLCKVIRCILTEELPTANHY